VQEIDNFRESDAFTPREKAVLTLAECMAHGRSDAIDDATMAELRKHFSEADLIEMGTYFALVTGFQRFNNAFNILFRCEG
jgi:alkylhydroperoxidase family enzyme